MLRVSDTCVNSLKIGEKAVQLPCFFPSISSVKTNIPPSEYAYYLELLEYPTYLVSAYDLIKPRNRDDRDHQIKLPTKESRKSVVLLDPNFDR